MWIPTSQVFSILGSICWVLIFWGDNYSSSHRVLEFVCLIFWAEGWSIFFKWQPSVLVALNCDYATALWQQFLTFIFCVEMCNEHFHAWGGNIYPLIKASISMNTWATLQHKTTTKTVCAKFHTSSHSITFSHLICSWFALIFLIDF